MTRFNTIKQQRLQRILELCAIARQRYLDVGENPRRTPTGLKGDDYMTDEERQEALVLERQLFPQEYFEGTYNFAKAFQFNQVRQNN